LEDGVGCASRLVERSFNFISAIDVASLIVKSKNEVDGTPRKRKRVYRNLRPDHSGSAKDRCGQRTSCFLVPAASDAFLIEDRKYMKTVRASGKPIFELCF
jgi:hypothetical protein